ncbi:MAG TPA: hypothetical protein PLA03_12280 [Acidobacteriota bacterium]|nr:hypothetical protein [Syntrophales bacterium]HQO21119.1 hypothetical protein [Acidobacteriota bacterium]
MFDVRELADIYGLPEEAVKAELLESLSNSLSAVFGAEIEVLPSEAGILEIYSYRDSSGDLQARSIPLSSIGRHAIKRIRRDLSLSLAKKRVLRDYDLSRDLVGRVVEGIIMKAVNHGSLSVRLQTDGPCNPRSLVGSCPYRFQTPKERGTYRPGDVLSFQVLKMSPVLENGMARLEITLGRNGRGLVEGLIMNHARRNSSGRDVKVRCVKRIAGAYSKVVSTAPIPRHVLKSVSEELKEYIRVVNS